MGEGGVEYFTVYALVLVSGVICLCLSLFVYHLLEVVYFDYSNQLPSFLSIFCFTWAVAFAILFLTKGQFILIYHYEEWEEEE